MSQASIAHYLEAFNYGLGEGSYNPFTRSLDVSHADFMDGKLHGQRGKSWEYKGNTFRIVRVRSANVVIGSALSLFIGGATRAGTLASSTKAVATTALSLTESDVAGGLLFTTGGTGAAPPQLRFIKDNDGTAGATTLTVAERDQAHNIEAISTPDAFTTLPDGTTTYGIFCHWEAKQSAGVSDAITAIALGTVTNGNWTIVIEEGPVNALVVGTTEDSVICARALAAYSGASRLTPIRMLRRFAP